ncbi:hypothetical protein AYI68_g3340 [Smittium mucronatum]|uniref:Uncharacterized protein n=1 Tax=Smittium mucronatum TaxID=133383 RepID=A0A1R0H074_9FUNG|nr:hypothetical protein AYI68_g3340 [Smittium mucronatum]
MIIASYAHSVYFSHVEYLPSSFKDEARVRLLYAFRDCFFVSDVIVDLKYAWSGASYTYSHFDPVVQDDSEDLIVNESVDRSEVASEQSVTIFQSNSDSINIDGSGNKDSNFSNDYNINGITSSSNNTHENQLAHLESRYARELRNGSHSSEDSDFRKSNIVNYNRKISEKRLKAGMRYAKRGTETYWVKGSFNHDKKYYHGGKISDLEGVSSLKQGLPNHSQDLNSIDKGYTARLPTQQECPSVTGDQEELLVFPKTPNGYAYIAFGEMGIDFEQEALGPNNCFENEMEAVYAEAKRVGCDPNYPVISDDSSIYRVPWTIMPLDGIITSSVSEPVGGNEVYSQHSISEHGETVNEINHRLGYGSLN